jgi:hypothetical protein
VRFYHIPPGALARDVIPYSVTAHLCVTDALLSDGLYANFYAERREAGNWITLDSGAFEGLEVSASRLGQAMSYVDPQEIVLPDVYKDSRKTIELSSSAYSELHLLYGFQGQYMVVAQGETYGEYLDSIKRMIDFGPMVQTVGVIEEVGQLFGATRREVVEAILTINESVDIHFLGVQEDLQEMYDPFLREHVRSCDTSKIIVWGLNGVTVEPTFVRKYGAPPYPGRKSVGGRVGYFDYHTASREAIRITRANIFAWDEFLQGSDQPSVES